MKNKLIAHSFGHAVLVILYIAGVAWFMSNAEHAAFDYIPKIFAGMIMLTLFVVSAAVTGTLVVGRPILLYLDGKKGDAIRFFGYTLGWLVLIFLLLLVTLLPR